MAIDPGRTEPRSRRAILAGAIGGLAGLLGVQLAQPNQARAASGDSLIIGNTSNDAGTSNTTLTTASSGTALLITQNGTGTALRGSAVGAGSIAGFFTANNGTGISGVTGNGGSYGVYAQNNGAAVTGGAMRAAGGNNNGLVATTANAAKAAIVATSSAEDGVAIVATNSSGAAGTGGALRAAGGNNNGLVATTANATKAAIIATNTAGSYGGGTAVVADGGSNTGVAGSSTSGFGVVGNSGSGLGVVGNSGSSYGVTGNSGSSYGVSGNSTDGVGVNGFSNNSIAVRGISPTSIGVYGTSTSGTGVYGISGSGYAVYGAGNGAVTGSFSKASGTFKIDHPLDPAHKFLQHSFVESPDMMNVYNGNETTDAKGEATIKLPAWFEALNRDFRYQLTVVGADFAQAIVSSKVKDGRFSIRTDHPAIEVSWQVTGIRQDAYANAHRIVVEAAKPKQQVGLYLHPKEHGQPESKGIDYAQVKASKATESKATLESR